MGMFDDIIAPAEPCPKEDCDGILDRWQSKSGPCTLSKLPPEEVDRYYDMCPECNTWVEYRKIVKEYEWERVVYER